jgi:hypothetical protein
VNGLIKVMLPSGYEVLMREFHFSVSFLTKGVTPESVTHIWQAEQQRLFMRENADRGLYSAFFEVEQ